MKLGRFTLKAIETGHFRLDGGAMFGVVPRVLWEKTDPADADNRISMHMRALYVEGDGRRALVDSGAGTKLGEKMLKNYLIECLPVRDVLKASGIDPDAITDVIATHLHFDHAGGYTYFDEEGRPALSFPDAVHYIQKRQWDAALNPNEKDRASFFPENFLPIADLGRLKLLDGEAEIFPGVTVLPVDGHTDGQQVVLIETGEGSLLYCGDLIPLASHVNLPYIMAYDHHPLQTLGEKKELLGRAADGDWILFFEHDPKIAACRVRRNEKGRFEIYDTGLFQEEIPDEQVGA
ncbi:MAG: MBL fold metallo-hydrolase [Candidatus Krumholzibacteriota bacterium]|nr:MBL fold metallo-hydrolase [Candidatus Krumholzibacteriota bacterium]